ncbi:hypothetical protein M758_10G145600 [Ceratodon purpureus]|nr:hypothetical protein M758_10G145600 [Ceratodon purpureus]
MERLLSFRFLFPCPGVYWGRFQQGTRAVEEEDRELGHQSPWPQEGWVPSQGCPRRSPASQGLPASLNQARRCPCSHPLSSRNLPGSSQSPGFEPHRPTRRKAAMLARVATPCSPNRIALALDSL